MEKVNVIEVDAYAWNCPKCALYNCKDKCSNLVWNWYAEEFEVREVTNRFENY